MCSAVRRGRYVTAWEPAEREYLESKWLPDAMDQADLTLAVAVCPNCVHENAFSHIHFGTGFVSGPGDFELTKLGADFSSESETYRAKTIVDCRCGAHDDKGCGRDGMIGIPS